MRVGCCSLLRLIDAYATQERHRALLCRPPGAAEMGSDYARDLASDRRYRIEQRLGVGANQRNPAAA